jgi:hypothetical protein
MKNIKPSFCKLDMAHLFDGLFVPTNGRERGRLYVAPRRFGDVEVSFQGFAQLGPADQSILLAVAAQLGIDGKEFGENKGGEEQAALWKKLQVEGNTEGAVCGSIKTTLYSIMRDAGYENLKATEDAKACLKRLGNAQVREVNKASGWDRRCNLVSFRMNHKDGVVFIATNPRLTGAIFKGQHCKVSLYERNTLETGVAKMLHCWLSSNINLGEALGYGNGAAVDTLIPHIWGPGEISRKTKCVRRGQIKDALDEIKTNTARLNRGGGWIIDQTSSGMMLVSRPKTLPLVEVAASICESMR